MRRFLSLCAVVGGISWIAACGGNVVVDGEGGAGGQGGQGGVGATGPGGGPPATGVGGGEQQTFCGQVCAALAAANCDTGDNCLQGCADTFAQTPAGCKDELAVYLDCYVGVLSQVGCALEGNVCNQEVLAYADCLNAGTGGGGFGGGPNPGCGDVECSGSDDGSCACKGFCQGQTRAVECAPQGDTYSCDCFLDGNQVGACSEVGNACDIELGCCSVYFGDGV